MTERDTPRARLREELGDAFDRAELVHQLSIVDARLRRRRRARGLAVAGATLAALVAVGVVAAPRWRPDPSPIDRAAAARRPGADQPSARSVEVATPSAPVLPPPLRLEDGRALEALEGEAGEVRFRDGSRLVLDPGGALRALASSADEVHLELERGRARFDVRPGGPRRWTIEAGAARVEVLGTSFTVTRDGARAEVAVHRGHVRVATVDEERVLHAGERLAVGEPASEPIEPGGSPSERARAEPDLETLLARADRARREGRTEEAMAQLERVVVDHPASSVAPSAALSWARLLEQAQRGLEAEAVYRRCIALDPPPALLDLAFERLLRGQLRRGDTPGATRTLEAYRERVRDERRRAALGALLVP